MAQLNLLNWNQFLVKVCALVTDRTGIQLGEKQKHMVVSRLKRRILELGLEENQYENHFDTHRDSEIQSLVSLFTTHHTYFFREFRHFEYLEEVALKAIVKEKRSTGDKVIRIWSAACSRGQEVYSLAMFLTVHLSRLAPDFKFEILGSDVDPESVKIAKNGVYRREEIKEIPMQYLANHWQKGSGEIANFVKAKDTLKKSCQFEVVNLQSIPPHLKLLKFDIIFCRNVFIYFEQEQIKRITDQFLRTLQPWGSLIVGISESLANLGHPIVSKGPSIYMLKGKDAVQPLPNLTPGQTAKIPQPEARKKIRVFSVDDSPTIHTLLKKILSDENDFEIVATAKTGLEAASKRDQVQFDVMTLDIHMPEQTGLEYLQALPKSGHPPIVVISSVSRDDSELAIKCLEAGAFDYIEKPALNNLAERAEEIRTKLRCAVRAQSAPKSVELEKSFQISPEIPMPDKKLILAFGSLRDGPRIGSFLKEGRGIQPPTVVLLKDSIGALPALIQRLGSESKRKVVALEQGQAESLLNDTVYVGDFKTCAEDLLKFHGARRVSISIFGEISKDVSESFKKWTGSQILIEDHLQSVSPLGTRATDSVPATSFGYCARQFLMESSDERRKVS